MNPYPKDRQLKQRRAKHRRVNERKKLEKRAEELVKQVIYWRDGMACVLVADEGGRCGGQLVWGHVQTQHNSPWLRYSLSNVFVICSNHNLLDHNGDKGYGNWYSRKWGQQAADDLQAEMVAHVGKKPGVVETREHVAHLEELVEAMHLFPITGLREKPDHEEVELVKAGFYGPIIKEAWRKEKWP